MASSYNTGPTGTAASSMPTGAPGFVPRRSSYASVVAGGAAGSPHQYHPPSLRSGAFSHLISSNNELSYDSTYHNGHSRYDSRSYDMEYGTNGGTHGRSGSWGRGGQLPSFSSAFGPLVNGYGYAGFGGGSMDYFFTPSYLKGSRYVQRLEDAHRAKVMAHKEGHSAHSSQAGSLSTSASSVNLHTKMAPSHRGMTYDLIEKAPPVEDETLAPLPSRWNQQDKYGGLEVLSDGQEVKFTGPKSDRERDHEACSIRADHPMPPQCGIYYYEVTIISRKREESSIAIGFSARTVPLSRLPGWEPDSWAYHGDDGHSFCCQSSGKHYGPPFNAGDVIGCGINFRTSSAFFTKNGEHLGTAFRDINKVKLYPSVGMKRAGEHIRVNFGQSPFIFDIDGMMSASNNFPYSHLPDDNSPADSLDTTEDSPLGTQNLADRVTGSGSESRNDNTPFADEAVLSILRQLATRLQIIVQLLGAGTTSLAGRSDTPRLNDDRDGDLASLHRREPDNPASADISRRPRTVRFLEPATVGGTKRTLSSDERIILRVATEIDELRDAFSRRDTSVTSLRRQIERGERVLDYFIDLEHPNIQPRLERVLVAGEGGVSGLLSAPPFPASRSQTQDTQTRGISGQVSDTESIPFLIDLDEEHRLEQRPNFMMAQPNEDQIHGGPPRLGVDYTTYIQWDGSVVVHERLLQPDPSVERSLEGPKTMDTMTNEEKQQEKDQIRQQIEATSTAKLALPLSETELIHSLVSQFLSHDGYVETAKAFAEEVHAEKQALNLDPNAIIQGVDVREDEDAGHRQKIRKAVLEGDIERALKHTHAYYPNVLRDNEHVSFRLKCRKFIEMIREGAEMQNSSTSNGGKKSNGHNGDWYDDIINHDMELDDHHSQSNNWDRMDTEESSEQMEYAKLLQDTLAYGKALQAEYKDDPRREVRKALEDAFALIAYQDPLNAKEVAHLLDPIGRAAVAEELNSAILHSLGKSSTAALEKLIQQTTVLLEELGEGGGPGAFVSVDDFVKIKPPHEL